MPAGMGEGFEFATEPVTGVEGGVRPTGYGESAPPNLTPLNFFVQSPGSRETIVNQPTPPFDPNTSNLVKYSDWLKGLVQQQQLSGNTPEQIAAWQAAYEPEVAFLRYNADRTPNRAGEYFAVGKGSNDWADALARALPTPGALIFAAPMAWQAAGLGATAADPLAALGMEAGIGGGGGIAMGAEGLGAGGTLGATTLADLGLTGGGGANLLFDPLEGAFSGEFLGDIANLGGLGFTPEYATQLGQLAVQGAGAAGGAVGPIGGTVAGGAESIPAALLEKLKKYLAKDPLGALLNAGSGIYGLYQSQQMRKLAEQASQQEDPFGPYRAQYAQQLAALSANPNMIFDMPGYKAGEQAVERRMAAQGYLGSGNMAVALRKYGGDFYNQEANRLAALAGAQFAPGGGNQLLLGTQAANDLASRALASLGYAARGWYNA